jgi:hypothetical protein
MLGTVLSVGCTGIPENIKPVEGFEATRYPESVSQLSLVT